VAHGQQHDGAGVQQRVAVAGGCLERPGGEQLAAGRPARAGARADEAHDRAGALLAVLDPIEQYWGFPGRQRIDRLAALFAAADYDNIDQPSQPPT
jgi:hypothetical protein